MVRAIDMSKITNNKAIIALMLVLFIDGMGQGIIFPILTKTITNSNSTLFLSHVAQSTRNIWYGILIGVYYLMWFISAPILGDWSDKVGRKKALSICLILAAVSFLMSAFAFALGNLYLLIVARIIGGATSGDQAIAKAAVIDLCPKEKQSIYLGFILFSVTLGLMIGPLIGSFLQNPDIFPLFNVTTPFYFAFIIAVVNLILIKQYFAETTVIRNVDHIRWLQAPKLFIDAILYKKIRLLLISYTLTQIGWQIFYIYMPNFVSKVFKMTPIQVGSMLMLIGLGIGLGVSVLPTLCKNFNYKYTAITGYVGLLIGNIIFIFANNSFILWCSTIPSASLFGLAVVNILPLFSARVSSSRQGWIMGVTGSVVALTGGLGALFSGFLASINHYFPYLFSSLVIIAGIIFLVIDNNPFIENKG